MKGAAEFRAEFPNETPEESKTRWENRLRILLKEVGTGQGEEDALEREIQAAEKALGKKRAEFIETPSPTPAPKVQTASAPAGGIDLFKELGINVERRAEAQPIDLFKELGIQIEKKPKESDSVAPLAGVFETGAPPEGETSSNAPIRGSIIKDIPFHLGSGTAESIAKTRAAHAEGSALQLDKTIKLVERIGSDNPPTAAEIAEIDGAKWQAFIGRAIAQKAPQEEIDKALNELRAQHQETLRTRQIQKDVASSTELEAQERTPKDASFLEKATISAARSTGPSLAALMLPGGAPAKILAGSAAALGAAYGHSYAEAEAFAAEKGIELTPEHKRRIATLDSVFEGVGEAFSLKVALKIGVPFFEKILTAMGAEASSEAVTSLLQDANRMAQYDPDMTAKDFAYNALLSGTAGAIGGGAMGAVAGAKEKVDQKVEYDRMVRAVDDLVMSEPVDLPTPEEEAVRLLDPKVSGQPFSNPMEAFKAAVRSNPDQAAELAEGVLRTRELDESVPLPARIAKDMLEAGQITVKQMADFQRAVQRRAIRERTDTKGTSEVVQEALAVESDLAKFAGDYKYVPTEQELEEVKIADAIHTLTIGKPQKEAELEVGRRLPDTMIGRAVLDMITRGTQDWNNNDYKDFREIVGPQMRAAPNAMARYYKALVDRQARGLYPFANERSVPFDDTWDIGVPKQAWTNEKGTSTPEPQPGEAIAAVRDKTLATKAAGLVSTWLKAITPSASAKIVDENYNPKQIARLDDVASGYSLMVGPRTGFLGVYSGLAEADYVEVLAHEFGHFMGAYLRGQSPKSVQEALTIAWSIQKKKMLNMTLEEAYRQMRGPAGLNMARKYDSLNLKGKVRDQLHSEFLRSYLFSYAEWEAHQMERLVTSGNIPELSKPIEGYFKKYKALLKKFFDKFGSDFAPDKTFEQFIQLGRLRERARAMNALRGEQVKVALKEFGFDSMTPDEELNLKEDLTESLRKVQAPQSIRDELRAAGNDMQQRALRSINNLGHVEALLFTPREDSNVKLSAEEWVTSLEDAWLPGQNPNAPLRAMSQQPLGRSKAASRIGSFVKNSLKYSKYFRRFNPDNSGYEGHLDNYSWFAKIFYSLEQWAKINPHIDQLQNYIGQVREWARDKMAWVSRADERLRQWRTLTNAEQKVLGRFMLDQTLEGKFFNMADPAIRQKYPLTPRTQDMYQKIKSDFDDFLSAVEGTLINQAAKRMARNPFTTAAEIQRIKTQFNALRSKPYFPLSRFGAHIVTVKATQHIRIKGKLYAPGDVMHFEAFDTEWARAAELDRIKGAYPSGDVKLDHASEAVRSLMGMPTPILEAIKSNKDIALTNDQKKALDEYMYKIAPGQSFAKHLISRKGVEGYTEDVQRAYADYFFHGASHLARIKHSEPLAEYIRATDVTADLIELDSSKRRLIANYMRRHFDYLMHPENDWASVRAGVAVAYLSAIMKTAVMNLTQVPMVTYPHLAAKFGDGKAIRALQSAYSKSIAMYHVTKALSKEEEEAITRWVQGAQPLPGDEKIITQWSKLSTQQRQMLREAQLEGWIDESMAMELAAMSEGSWLTRFKATSKAGYYWRAFSHYSMIPFQAAEKLNRRVTALAAFDLAMQAGGSYAEAYQAAREAVSATQFEYAKWNRAELLRGKKGVFFMFWQYMLNTLFFATGGDRGWWRWWAMMLAVAGFQGLPGSQNFLDLATWALTKWHPDGQRVNAQYELRKLTEELAEILHVSPDLLQHGISRYGFGLMPFADMSGSMGMGRIIPGTELLASPGEKWSETVAKGLTEAGGATSSLVMRMLQAATVEDADMLRRIEKGMPITFAQQMLTAMRWYTHGASETLGGADLTKFDTNDPWQLAEIVAKGLGGFQPRSLAEGRPEEGQPGRDEMLIKQDFANYYRIRREILLKKLDFEMEHGDTETISEVREAIKNFNENVPSSSLAITNLQIIQMRKSREKSRALQEMGDAPQRMNRDLYNKIDDRQL